MDDERPARRWLIELLRAHPEIQILGEADGVDSARELILRERPDVIFLDVQMPPDTGFDLLPSLSGETRIVFVTAFDNFAVKAFETNALDYLLKPVHPERLAETVPRLLTTVATTNNSLGAAVTPHLSDKQNTRLQLEDLLPLRDRGLLRMVPVGQVAAIRAEGAYTQIIISGQNPMLILQSIGDWEERLPSPPFVRLDRSRLINLNRITQVNSIDRDRTLVNLDRVSSPFELGRSASRRLRTFLR